MQEGILLPDVVKIIKKNRESLINYCIIVLPLLLFTTCKVGFLVDDLFATIVVWIREWFTATWAAQTHG